MQANESIEDFEELLAALAAGEIDTEGFRALAGFVRDDPRLAERYRRFVETLDALNLPGPGELEIPELERRTAEPSRQPDTSHLRNWRPALALGALLICVPLLLPLFLSDDSQPLDPVAVVTHTDGLCTGGETGDARAKPGTRLSFPELSAGPDSICDLEFQAPVRMKLRLLSNSRLKFVAHDRYLNLSLESGEALLDAERMPANVRLSLHTAGHLVEVLGTQLVLRRPDFENMQVELVNGAAHVRSAHYLHLDGLRHGLHTKKRHHVKLARSFPELFREVRHVLTAGGHLRFAHPADFERKTAPLFERLNAHVLTGDAPDDDAGTGPAASAAHAPVTAAGGHEISPELLERLQATYAGHEHLHEHFRDGPPPAETGTLSRDRSRRLSEHFADLQARAAAGR